MTDLITHRALCEIGAKWCKRPASQNGHGCNIAIIEGCANNENADVIGFRHSHPSKGSVLIEVKVSRSDFLADKKKRHRIDLETGMGKWRYFLCPENLITVKDMEEYPKWGLLYSYPNGRIKVIVGPLANKQNYGERQARLEEFAFKKYNFENEQLLLIKSLSRFENLDDMIELQRESSRAKSQTMKYQSENHTLRSSLNIQRSLNNRKIREILELKALLHEQGISGAQAGSTLTFTTLYDIHELEEYKRYISTDILQSGKDNSKILAVIDVELEKMHTHQFYSFKESCMMRYKLDLSLTFIQMSKNNLHAKMAQDLLLNSLASKESDSQKQLDQLINRGIIETVDTTFQFSESFKQFAYSYIYDAEFFRKMTN